MIGSFNFPPWAKSKATCRLLLTLIILLFTFCAQAQKPEFKSLTNDEFVKLLGVPNVQLVDVRTPQEFDAGHIPGAVNINLFSEEFEEEIKRLDKKRPVALYCRSGSRSKEAARKLTEWGYTVSELNKGMMNWNGKTE